MKPKSLRQWIEIYEAKRNEKVSLDKGCRLFYLAKRGFSILKTDLKTQTLIIMQMCGDGMFWLEMAEITALNNGFNKIAAITWHPIEAFLKNFGFEIVVRETVNGKTSYLCQDETGRKVTATPVSDTDYLVVLYITEKLTSSKMFEPGESEE